MTGATTPAQKLDDDYTEAEIEALRKEGYALLAEAHRLWMHKYQQRAAQS